MKNKAKNNSGNVSKNCSTKKINHHNQCGFQLITFI